MYILKSTTRSVTINKYRTNLKRDELLNKKELNENIKQLINKNLIVYYNFIKLKNIS